MTNAFRRFSACAGILLLLACPLAAQEFSGNINGRVADSSEAVLPGVQITLSSPAIQGERATISVESGSYLFRLLPPGTYSIVYTPGILTSRFDVGGSTMGSQTGYRTYGLDGQNNINVDGINTTFRQGSAGLYFDYGAFSEINVAAAGNNAEVAAPGVFVNTVIKIGGNDLRGQAYVDWEDDSFQGDNLTKDLQDRGVLVGDKFVRYNDFNANAGGPLIRGLAQGSQIITMESLGTYHLPSRHLTNIRFEKTFAIDDRQRVQTMFDLFNVFNADTVLGVETFSNLVQDRNGNTVPRFARATQILNPRIFRLDLRYEW